MGRVGVGSHGDDFASEFPVAPYDIRTGIGFAQSVMESAGVQFNPYIFTDKSAEYFVQDILVTSVSVFAVFVRAVTDNVIDMSVYIHFRKKGQIFQNGFKIFHIAVGFPAVLEKFRIIWIGSVNNMRGADHEVKGDVTEKLMEIIPQMRLEAQFDTKADVQLILIFFPQSTECIPVCGDIYRKIRLFRFRYPGIIRVQMFGETDTAEPKVDGSVDHFFHRCAGVCRKRGMHVAVPGNCMIHMRYPPVAGTAFQLELLFQAGFLAVLLKVAFRLNAFKMLSLTLYQTICPSTSEENAVCAENEGVFAKFA